MKKIYIITLLMLTGIGAKAQQLASYIPADAQAVASVKGGNILELISASAFSESMAGKALLHQISKNVGQQFSNVNDFGVQLDANAYYYYQNTDSARYQCVLLPLADAAKFAQLFQKSGENIKKDGNYSIFSDGTNTVVIWDSKKALLIFGETNSYYFSDNAVSQRYGIPDVYSYNYDYTESTEAIEPVPPIVDSIGWTDAPPPPVATIEAAPIDNLAEVPGVTESTYPADSIVEYSYTDTTSFTFIEPATDNNDYYRKKDLKDRILDSLESVWTLELAKNLLETPPTRSILKNADYIKSLDPTAEASIWISNPFMLYGNSEIFNELLLGSNLFAGIGNLKGHLYVEDDHIKVKTNIELSDELAESCKKIYSRKINRKFLKYVNSEKALGFMGYAINTEAYLNELPKIVRNAYPSTFAGLFNEKETINLVVDLISLLLDEEAVAEVIKGDALIVLNGVSEKDVTYTDYEYDDNFNSVPVQKTKTETIPDFLFMLSSDNTKLIENLLALGIKEGEVKEKNGIYSIDAPNEYFTLHLLMKDGIVFMGSSLKEINKIRKGTFVGNISRKHRKMIRKNSFMACFNSGNVYKAIPRNELLLFTKNAPFLNEMENMGDFYLKSNGIKGNNVSMEFVVETPDKHGNSLKYLLSLFEEM